MNQGEALLACRLPDGLAHPFEEHGTDDVAPDRSVTTINDYYAG